ncbi:MAG: hypothetical protein EA378_05920 [Phycisphaerales bacterium]|nr:MAG: hypothetical protein EA378_05920 [Phycisphaerales bacterium]
MARTSTSVGMGVTITILGILTFAFFVTTIIFFGQMNSARNDLADYEARMSEWVTPADQQNDQIRVFADLADRENKSAIAYLAESLNESIRLGLGGRGSITELRQASEPLVAGSSRGLVGAVRQRDSQAAQLNTRIREIEASLETAQQALLAERQKVERISQDFSRQLASMEEQVQRTTGEIESYRTGINAAEIDMDQRVERIRTAARDTEAQLQDNIRRLESENLRLQDAMARLQEGRAGDRLMPTDEFALVDGEVTGLNPVENQVFISLGRRDRLRLGMRFQVYADPSIIRPNADGDYPPGKATIEVVSMGETSSAARIIRQSTGNPVARGDVIANPLYDPNKIYTFLVYGLFDINNDGRATAMGRDELQAQIERWGGRITDELTGDVDFLVLGRRPTLPPAPPATAPLAVQQEYIRLSQLVRRYDDLLERAQRTSLPILNQNRLATLLDGR